ncbi:hypothetical protein L596_008300 [Steinernema carpocapsae]|uniref:C2H2-type domain-containing protein n=1 Tax=Steinernema carpocapsae TaxID=34508 RepID=A0A4U5PCB8_STECR|nr:hypothetical protein L596_008300 [Steinernema carpocapsae]
MQTSSLLPDFFTTVMRELTAVGDVPLSILTPKESPNKPEDSSLFFHQLHSQALSALPCSDPNTPKRRRRFGGNADNTLDGLVARKAEKEEPISKRYKNEKDAIETPNEEDEQKVRRSRKMRLNFKLQRLETDPDVNTRTCSVCGYKGKWVSEMIRHKRVHTNARPFKCKFCSRTSKWKADLIRHVAKTHGIRVVSKFSRSKAFESNRGEKQISAAELFQQSPTQNMIVAPTPRSISGFRCLECDQEQDSFELIINHLQNVHNLSTHSCGSCGSGFDSLLAAESHCALPESSCSPIHLRVHYTSVCRSLSDDGSSSDTGSSIEESPRSSSEEESSVVPSSLLFSPQQQNILSPLAATVPPTSNALPFNLYPSLFSSLCAKPQGTLPVFPQMPLNMDFSMALLQLQNLSSQMFLNQLAMAK